MKAGYTRVNLVLSKKTFFMLKLASLRECRDVSDIADEVLQQVLKARLSKEDIEYAERLVAQEVKG